MKKFLCGAGAGILSGGLLIRLIDIDRQKKHLRVDNGKPLKKGGCNKCSKSQ